jgi:hypothetical protein
LYDMRRTQYERGGSVTLDQLENALEQLNQAGRLIARRGRDMRTLYFESGWPSAFSSSSRKRVKFN